MGSMWIFERGGGQRVCLFGLGGIDRCPCRLFDRILSISIIGVL
jgi:hypothetical protein